MLVLPEPVRDAVLGAAREGAPAEICGVFGGRHDEERSRVRSYYPAENVAAAPTVRYRIDPEELFSIVERLEGRGEDIVGFYHSHPRGPTGPSETDVADATWPDRSYAIVSPDEEGDEDAGLESGATLRSWRWRAEGGAFERERVVVE